MARPARPLNVLVGLSMDTQADLLRTQHHAAPLFEAATKTGDWALMSEIHNLAHLLKVARKSAKRISGMAEGLYNAGHDRQEGALG